MALVFLSYDREDVAKARSISLALEKAGHTVWWDSQIEVGAQYSKEIEQALAAADAVVVLWSAQSVESAWVRDEAASGRDTGRMVPVQLDKAVPPLGFRQYQNIDFSSWSGRGRPPDLEAVLAAIDRLALAPGVNPSPPKPPRPSGARRGFGRALALAFVAIAIFAGVFWQLRAPQNDVPSVTVIPADGSASAKGLASDLLVKLGSLQSSSTVAMQLLEPGSGSKSDLIVKIGQTGLGAATRATMSLYDNKARILLWSGEFQQPNGNDADLRQQIAYSTAQILGCASEALPAIDRKIRLATVRLYLAGCVERSNLIIRDSRAAIVTFAKVTDQAPKFAGGWAKLLVAEAWYYAAVDQSDAKLRSDLQKHIVRARLIDPNMAESYLAEGWLQKPRPISGWMKFADLAVAHGPDNPVVLQNRAFALSNVGRMEEALGDAMRAVQLDPLSPYARSGLIEHLVNIDRIEAARRELEESERLWPGATNVLHARAAFESRVGDPARMLDMLRNGDTRIPMTSATESYLRARLEPSPVNVTRAIGDAFGLYRKNASNFWVYIETLALFGRHEQLVDALMTAEVSQTDRVIWVLFRPVFRKLHHDLRFMRIAQRYGLIDYWSQSGKWPDFCAESGLPYDCKAEAAKLR